jgi:hypothetical protein
MPAATNGVADQLDPGAINRRLADLERQVKELRAAKRLEAATIGAGGLTIAAQGGLRVVDGFGNLLQFIGALSVGLSPSGDTQYGVLWYRQNDDGTLGAPLLTVYTSSGVLPQTLGLFDAAGNNLWTDDGTSGQGIGRPYLELGMERSDNANWIGTSSGTYQDMYFGRPIHQHPKVVASGLAICPTGVNASIQLTANATPIGSTAITGATSVVQPWSIGSVTWPGGHMAAIDTRLQARITSGSGTVQVALSNFFGQQS